ncbi:MAG: cytochrome P450, partial [Myxococcales bacterium]|nr:cytochrome P450 [Myxococcales bacterium]
PLPPGPRGRLIPVARMLARPNQMFRRWRDRYGEPFMVTSPNGQVVEVWEPATVRRVFTADHDDFAVFSPDSIAILIGHRSLLTIAGPTHRRERKLLGPPFHGARMRAYGEAMIELTRARIAELDAGSSFVAMDLTQGISLDVILRTVFGVDDARELDVYRTVVIEAIESAAPVLFFFPALRREFGGVGPYARLVARQRRFVDLLKGQIERVRPQASERADILSMMLEARYEDGEPMSDESLVDELRTLLLAGHETTAITLAWALYLVHRHPAVYHRLREELDGLGESPTPEAIAHLPYLDAVVNESLRLHPVVQEVMRTLTKPFELGAYTLPPGVTIAVNIFLAHRRTELFPEPEEFRPERFLDRTFSPFEYMPFGGGPRRCLGAAFALYEMKLVLATLLGDLELDLASEGPVEPVRRNLTMAPRGGVPLRVVRRRRPA